MGHLDTEGLFRKSGSVVRVKSLRVSDLRFGSLRDSHWWRCLTYCFDPVGQTGPGRGLSVHCSPAGRGWTSEAVFPWASRAGSDRRLAQCFPEGPGAARGRGEDLGHGPAVLRAARPEFKRTALLLQFPTERLPAGTVPSNVSVVSSNGSFVFEHMWSVCVLLLSFRCAENKMDSSNLSVIFAPNLFHCGDGGDKLSSSTEKRLKHQAAAVQCLIDNAQHLGMCAFHVTTSWKHLSWIWLIHKVVNHVNQTFPLCQQWQKNKTIYSLWSKCIVSLNA